MDSFELRFDNKSLKGFDKVVVSLSLDEIAGEFTFKVANRIKDGRPLELPELDKEVEILVDGSAIMKGYVEVVENFASDQDGFVSLIHGREVTCDLVDSSITYSKKLSGPIDTVIADIVKPFSIKTVANSKKSVSITTEKGARVWDTIELLARKTGELLWTRGDGILNIGVGSRDRFQKSLAMENIKMAHSKFSSHETFSEYIVMSETESNADSWGSKAKRSSRKKGESRRYRPLVIKGEASSLNPAEAMKRAEWEASMRVSRSAAATVTIAGFRIGSEILAINRLVEVNHPMIGIKREMLISSVMYSFSKSDGSVSTLGLSLPDAFNPMPADGIKAKKDANKVKGWS